MLVIQSLRPGPAASSLTAFFGGIGFFVSGSLAVGLFLDSPKCRWLVFIFAAIAAGYYMALGIFASQRDHVALWAGLSLGVATIAGWILLLDRKPNWAKIIVGAMLLLSCEVFGLTALKTLFASTFS